MIIEGRNIEPPEGAIYVVLNGAIYDISTGDARLVSCSVYIVPPIIIRLRDNDFFVKEVPDTEQLIIEDGEIWEFVKVGNDGVFIYDMIDEPRAMEDLVCS